MTGCNTFLRTKGSHPAMLMARISILAKIGTDMRRIVSPYFRLQRSADPCFQACRGSNGPGQSLLSKATYNQIESQNAYDSSAIGMKEYFRSSNIV